MTGVICLGLLLILALLYAGLRIWWENDGQVVYTAPLMTPDEIKAAKGYAAAHSPQQKHVESQPDPQPTPQPDPQLDPKEEQRKQRQKQIQEWLEQKRAKEEAEARAKEESRAKERAAIARDFPAWLVELVNERNIQPTYDNVKALHEWVKYILEFGQQQLGGKLSVRLLKDSLGNSERPQLPNVSSWHFFSSLLKILEREKLLNVQLDRSRHIPDDIFTRF